MKTYFSLLLIVIVSTGCSALSPSPNAGYNTEFGGISGGSARAAKMNDSEVHDAIDRAALEGDLTAEEARTAHLQLDVKGHLTDEQIAVINRDRLAKRDTYETNKESLDVLRDVTQTGSSMTSDVNNTINTIKAIFGR